MTPTATGQDVWIVDVDETETRFDTREQIAEHVSALEQTPRGAITVFIDHGLNGFWMRLIGMKRKMTLCFAVEWSAGYASLMFYDDASSEHRALDTSNPVQPSEDIRKQIAHGELQPHPIDECMTKERAFAAIHEYFASGARPAGLSYRFVA